MPYVYTVAAAGTVNYSTSASADTEDAYVALRQATRGFTLKLLAAGGKAAAATVLNGIGHVWKRWTTAGSGGTTLTPAPKLRDAPAAATVAADKQTALTPGTVSGVVVLAMSHGGSTANQWVARDADSGVHVEGGSADELDGYSSQAGTSALKFVASVEIEE